MEIRHMSLRENIDKRLLESDSNVLELSDNEIDGLSDDDIEYLQEIYGGTTFLRLPPRERAIFDGLKTVETEVWTDLWGDDEQQLVSFAFLKNLRKTGNGFAVCELACCVNYYFTPKHVKPEAFDAVQEILRKADRGEQLATGEVLMYEIMRGPIDIWHFCYRYGVPLEAGKMAVEELDAHQWLVHLTERVDLLRYLEEE